MKILTLIVFAYLCIGHNSFVQSESNTTPSETTTLETTTSETTPSETTTSEITTSETTTLESTTSEPTTSETTTPETTTSETTPSQTTTSETTTSETSTSGTTPSQTTTSETTTLESTTSEPTTSETTTSETTTSETTPSQTTTSETTTSETSTSGTTPSQTTTSETTTLESTTSEPTTSETTTPETTTSETTPSQTTTSETTTSETSTSGTTPSQTTTSETTSSETTTSSSTTSTTTTSSTPTYCTTSGISCYDCHTLQSCSGLGSNNLEFTISCKQQNPNRPYCDKDKVECVAEDVCGPEAAGPAEECYNNGTRPDPTDCSQYIQCISDGNNGFVGAVVKCPTRTKFNIALGRCTSSSSCLTIDRYCNKANAGRLIRYPPYPANYAICPANSNQKIIVKLCKGEYVFNEQTAACEPVCKREGYIANNLNCKAYYNCVRTSGGYSITSNLCPKDYGFNPVTKICDANLSGCTNIGRSIFLRRKRDLLDSPNSFGSKISKQFYYQWNTMGYIPYL